MTKKGGSRHLKRLPAPASWPIHRKEFRWVVKSRAGPHSLNRSLPLLLIVRDVLGLVKNRREAKTMLSEGHVKVDGDVKREDDYPVGLMDIIEIPIAEKAFRVFPSKSGLRLHVAESDEKNFKLCKIVGKTIVAEGKLQLHLHDGKNILVKNANSEKPTEDVYRVNDVLKIEIPSYEILTHLKFEEGVLGIVDGGKNAGTMVEVKKIVMRAWPSKASVSLADSAGNQFETILDYVFPIGQGEPMITIQKADSR
ncbi:MAG: 30S ribosomal protein S4e [Candidatus Bathyarchaeota archaeon]